MASGRRSDASLAALAGYFRLLGESVRLKIILCLESGERSVMDIVHETGLKQAHVSRQLGQLWSEGILSRRKEGTRVFYALADKRLPSLLSSAEKFLRQYRRAKLGDVE